jgi:hypothetical protein
MEIKRTKKGLKLIGQGGECVEIKGSDIIMNIDDIQTSGITSDTLELRLTFKGMEEVKIFRD